MQKVVEHFQSNQSAGRSAGGSESASYGGGSTTSQSIKTNQTSDYPILPKIENLSGLTDWLLTLLINREHVIAESEHKRF